MNKYEEDDDVMVKDIIDSIYGSHLVVLNDDYTTFQTVINAFIDVLRHSQEQSEQLAWIIHTKGKASVKEGTIDKLKPYKDALTERGLRAIIESCS